MGSARLAPQNENVAASMLLLHNGCDWLMARGFTVLRYRYDNRRPVITIQACAKCDELNGVESVQTIPGNMKVRRLVATVQQCQVEWTEPG